jgi:hypothetical protein
MSSDLIKSAGNPVIMDAAVAEFQATIRCFLNAGPFRKTDVAIRIARAFATPNISEAFCTVPTRGNIADIMFTS